MTKIVNFVILLLVAVVKFWSLILIGFLDARPRCITCNQRYIPTDGMFGECINCVLTGEPVLDKDFDKMIIEYAEAKAISDELEHVPPIFDDDDLATFTFGVDQHGNLVIRQIDGNGSITWKSVGEDY